MFYLDLGEHVLKITAVDYVGNKTEKEVKFHVTATIESTISDINRSYSLGWIDNEGIKNSLLTKLRKSKLKPLQNELRAQKGKHITEGAYKLINLDIKSLMINI